jgi:hypothetical protein
MSRTQLVQPAATTDAKLAKTPVSAPLGAIGLTFAAAIFVSAMLLFGVQPMFTKMVLPWLGGSPAVWSVAMVFFQTALLIGYLYAHLSTRFLSGKTALAVHAGLLLLAFLTLPLTITGQFGDPPADGQALWLILVFTISVGLPFMALAATAPLLQAWFARTDHPQAANPYRLYAASNAGSFTTLIVYPLVIEPLFTLGQQRMGWTTLFATLAFLILASGIFALKRLRPVVEAQVDTTADVKPVRMIDRLQWIALAAIPSGLLVAVTAHLSTDVASAPLLWVVPLALFMLTFVLAFRDEGEGLVSTLEVWFPRLLPFVLMSAVGFVMPLGVQLLLHTSILFFGAMICHGRLYRQRPDASQLTEFYLWMSFGGMLGGLFAGLVAPLVFTRVLEYPLLLIALVACLTPLASDPSLRRQATIAVGLAFLAGLILLVMPIFKSALPALAHPIAVCFAAGFFAVYVLGRFGPLASAGAVAGAFAVLLAAPLQSPEAITRSFFGVNYVRLSQDGQVRHLTHGSTVHGAHRIKDLDGTPLNGRPNPTVYYHDKGGLALALESARGRKGGALGEVAILGLGAGALACQAQAGERWSYFEIDPEVVKLARTPAFFPFLDRCTPDARVVLGDARLKLKEETRRYDVIVLDTFSSDAVPAHLLTREAFKLYADFLAPGGMIVAHVSNRHMDLRSVAEGAGLANGLVTRSSLIFADGSTADQRRQLAATTDVVVMARTQEDLGPLVKDERWTEAGINAPKAMWTDDYANVVGAIWRRLW